MAAKILILEKHEILRRSLRVWLEFTFPNCCIFEAVDENQAVTLAHMHAPEVIMVDLNHTNGAAINPVKQLAMAAPASAIIALTDYNDDIHRAHALNSGASVFIYKRAILAQLQPALSAILDHIKEPQGLAATSDQETSCRTQL